MYNSLIIAKPINLSILIEIIQIHLNGVFMKKFMLVSLLPLSILYASEDTEVITPTPQLHSTFTFSTPIPQSPGNFITGLTDEQKKALKEYYITSCRARCLITAKQFVPALVAEPENLHARNLSRVETTMNTIINKVVPLKNDDTAGLEKYKTALKSISERITRDNANLPEISDKQQKLLSTKELQLYEKYAQKLTREISKFEYNLELVDID